MPRKKAEPAAAATALQAAAAATAPEPPAPVRKPGRKKAAASTPLLDLAARAAPAAPEAATPPFSDPAPPVSSAPVAVPVGLDSVATAAFDVPSAAVEQSPVPLRNRDAEPGADTELANCDAPPAAAAVALPPAVSPAVAVETMADRAARYRQRFLADDKPVARRPAPPPVAPPPRLHEQAEAAQGPRRALSMAEIAERQRAARSAAREPESRPVAPPRPAPESMQERALRFRTAVPDEAPPKPVTPAPIAQRTARPPDSSERAAHATHHRPADSISAAPAVALDTPAARSVGVALVLVARNHAQVIAARLAAWRQAVPDVDVRLAVVDLGSTDDTVAVIEQDSTVAAASCPGGLADPLRALAVAVRAVHADVAILAQADHPPGPRGIALVQAARSGNVAAWQVASEEGVVAVPAGALRKVVVLPTSLAQWAGEAGVPPPPTLEQPGDWRQGFVVALLGRPQRRRDRVLALLPRPLRPFAGKLAGLLAGP